MKIITLVIELKIIKAATIPDILHLLGSEIEFLSEESGMSGNQVEKRQLLGGGGHGYIMEGSTQFI